MQHNIVRRFGGKSAAAGTALMVGAGSAMAQVPTEVTSALEQAATDGAAVAALALLITIGIFAILVVRRAIK